MKRTITFIFPALMFFLLQTNVFAALVMTYENQALPAKNKNLMKFYWEDEKARVEGISGDFQGVVLALDNKMVLVDSKSKTYTEITEKDMKNMQNAMSKYSGVIEQQMKNMSPAQRAKMEKMGLLSMQPGKVKPQVYKKKAKGVSCQKWICDQYEVYSGKEKVADRWFATNINLDKKYSPARIMKSMEKMLSAAWMKQAKESISGRPTLIEVKSIDYQNGRPTHRMTLQDIQTQSVEGSKFQVPSGYSKRSIPSMPGAGS